MKNIMKKLDRIKEITKKKLNNLRKNLEKLRQPITNNSSNSTMNQLLNNKLLIHSKNI